MAATSTTETWDAAWTATERSRKGKPTDNIFDSYPTLEAFKKSGLEISDGGKEFQVNLMYAKNSGEWFDGYDTLNTDAVDGITAAFFPVRYVAVPITISFTEEQENKGSQKVFDLLRSKTDQSMLTMRDVVNAAIFGAQSGKSMLGLQDIVADSPTTGTVGGINRASNSWWRNTSNSSSATFISQSTTNVFDGVDRFLDVWDAISEGNDTPTHILTTAAIQRAYREALSSQGYARAELSGASSQQFAAVGGTGNSVPFYGAPVIADQDCSSSHAYFINMKYLKIKLLKGVNFAKTPFKEGPNQLAKVAFLVVGLQLTSDNCRRQGVATAITGA